MKCYIFYLNLFLKLFIKFVSGFLVTGTEDCRISIKENVFRIKCMHNQVLNNVVMYYRKVEK